jgi:hypothetical protein
MCGRKGGRLLLPRLSSWLHEVRWKNHPAAAFPRSGGRARVHLDAEGSNDGNCASTSASNPHAAGISHLVWHFSSVRMRCLAKNVLAVDEHGVRSISRTGVLTPGGHRHNLRHGSHSHVLDRPLSSGCGVPCSRIVPRGARPAKRGQDHHSRARAAHAGPHGDAEAWGMPWLASSPRNNWHENCPLLRVQTR